MGVRPHITVDVDVPCADPFDSIWYRKVGVVVSRKFDSYRGVCASCVNDPSVRRRVRYPRRSTRKKGPASSESVTVSLHADSLNLAPHDSSPPFAQVTANSAKALGPVQHDRRDAHSRRELWPWSVKLARR